jgi:hypothetical protein
VAFNGREALPNVACGPAQNRRTRRGALCIQYKHRKMARSFAGLWPPPPIPTYTVLGNHEREAARTTQLSMVVVSSTERGRTPHVSTSTVTASRRPRGWFRRARRGRKSSASCCERMNPKSLLWWRRGGGRRPNGAADWGFTMIASTCPKCSGLRGWWPRPRALGTREKRWGKGRESKRAGGGAQAQQQSSQQAKTVADWPWTETPTACPVPLFVGTRRECRGRPQAEGPGRPHRLFF